MTDLSQLVADLTKVPLSDTMPIVGKTAFTHLVEVHYAVPEGEEGFWSFLSMKPELFGNSQKTHLGHYSGAWAMRAKAKELGISIPQGKELDVVEKVRSEIRWRKRQLTDAEFRKIVFDQ